MGIFSKRDKRDGFAGARKALVIEYEDERGGTDTFEFDKPPTFVTEKTHYLTFAAGILRQEGIVFERIVKVAVLEIIFDEMEEGLADLKELSQERETVTVEAYSST